MRVHEPPVLVAFSLFRSLSYERQLAEMTTYENANLKGKKYVAKKWYFPKYGLA